MKKTSAPEFPPFTCGACEHIRRDSQTVEEKYWCWGNPFHTHPITGNVVRAYPIDNPNVPACGIFKPRMHG